VYFPTQEAQYFLTRLDKLGIAASSGSACAARSLEPSYVIEALSHSSERAKRSLRFSLGRGTTLLEIKRALALLKKA
jgi:cysteine desulfurase